MFVIALRVLIIIPFRLQIYTQKNKKTIFFEKKVKKIFIYYSISPIYIEICVL